MIKRTFIFLVPLFFFYYCFSMTKHELKIFLKARNRQREKRIKKAFGNFDNVLNSDHFPEFKKKDQGEKNNILHDMENLGYFDDVYLIKAIQNGAEPSPSTLVYACRNWHEKLALLVAERGVRLAKCDSLHDMELFEKLAKKNDLDIYHFIEWPEVAKYFRGNTQETKKFLKNKGLYSNQFWQQYQAYEQEKKGRILEALQNLPNNAEQEKHVGLAIKFGAQPTLQTLILAYRKRYEQVAKIGMKNGGRLIEKEFFKPVNITATIRKYRPQFVDEIEQKANGRPVSLPTYPQDGEDTFNRMLEWFRSFYIKKFSELDSKTQISLINQTQENYLNYGLSPRKNAHYLAHLLKLLESNVDLNKKDHTDSTPLAYLYRKAIGCREVVIGPLFKLFLENGADPAKADFPDIITLEKNSFIKWCKKHKTSLVITEINKNIKRYLKDSNKYKKIEDILNLPPYLTQEKINLSTRGYSVRTPLEYLWKKFCKSNEKEDEVFTSVCQLLLKNGADPEKASNVIDLISFLKWCNNVSEKIKSNSKDVAKLARRTRQSWLAISEIKENLKRYLKIGEKYKKINDLLDVPSYWLVGDKLNLNASTHDFTTVTPLAYLWKEYCKSNGDNNEVFTSLCQLLLKNGADPKKSNVSQNTDDFLGWCEKCRKPKDYWRKKAKKIRHNFEEYGSKKSGAKALWAIQSDNNVKKNNFLKKIGIYEDPSEFKKKPQEEKKDILKALHIINCETKYIIKAIENGAHPTEETLWFACSEAHRGYGPTNEGNKLLFFCASAGLRLVHWHFDKKWLGRLARWDRNIVDIYQFVRHDNTFSELNNDEGQFLKGFNPKSNPQKTKHYLKKKGLYADPFWQQFKTCQQSKKDDVLEGLELLENNADQEKHMKLAIMFGAQPTIDTLVLIYKKNYEEVAKLFIAKQKQLNPDKFCIANGNVKSTKMNLEKYAYSQEISKNNFTRMQKWFNQFIENEQGES